MNSFDDLGQHLAKWYSCKIGDFAWNGSLPDGLHPYVEEFYRRLGALTLNDGMFAIEGLPSPFAGQDLIVPAPELVAREDRGFLLIHENQGCWTAGQMPGSETLWSSIDLETGETPYPGDKLFDMGVSLKTALITHALHETIMSAVDAGPALDLRDWQAAENEIINSGVIEKRSYITPDEGTLRIGWTDQYMASCWADEDQFTWIVRRGDRAKGERPRPYTVGKPRSKTETKLARFLKQIFRRKN